MRGVCINIHVQVNNDPFCYLYTLRNSTSHIHHTNLILIFLFTLSRLSLALEWSFVVNWLLGEGGRCYTSIKIDLPGLLTSGELAGVYPNISCTGRYLFLSVFMHDK